MLSQKTVDDDDVFVSNEILYFVGLVVQLISHTDAIPLGFVHRGTKTQTWITKRNCALCLDMLPSKISFQTIRRPYSRLRQLLY